ncbi:hypothetical protein [Dolichospermum phage Dfl-JY45]
MNQPLPIETPVPELFLVLDLECTCSDDDAPADSAIPRDAMEIIEVGAAWCSPGGEVLDRFARLVRPTERPALTQFATQLTGITQAMVDNASSLDSVLYELDLWLTPTCASRSVAWGAWGASDHRQIDQETSRKALATSLLTLPFVNLKAAFARKRRVKQMGMRAALRTIGADVPASQHRALSDALAICALVPHTLAPAEIRS